MSTPTDRRPRVLSGIQPTADSFHFGNYLGALRQWVDLQDDHEPFFFIADLHAITVEQDPKVLRERTLRRRRPAARDGHRPGAVGDLRAVARCPAHAQLAWVLQCLTGFGEARRMTQFKDKSAKGGAGTRASVGLFTYPILQAADILLYRPHYVPVGEDQRQHLELTRDLAQRFNHRYKKTFRLPEPYILKATAKISDLQDPTAKMSKSASSPAGIIELLDDPQGQREEDPVRGHRLRAARSASTPRSKPGVSNLLTIYSALTGRSDRRPRGASTPAAGYGDLKKDLAEVVVDFVTPFRERYGRTWTTRPSWTACSPDGARAGARRRRVDARRRSREDRFPAARRLLGAPRDRCIGPGRGRPGRIGPWPTAGPSGSSGSPRRRARTSARTTTPSRRSSSSCGPATRGWTTSSGPAPATPTTTATTTRRRSRSSRSSRWCRC